jgi:hypothetical protein
VPNGPAVQPLFIYFRWRGWPPARVRVRLHNGFRVTAWCFPADDSHNGGMRAIVAALAALGGGMVLAAFVVSAARGDGSEAVRMLPGLRGVRFGAQRLRGTMKQVPFYSGKYHLLPDGDYAEPAVRESGNCNFTAASIVCGMECRLAACFPAGMR